MKIKGFSIEIPQENVFKDDLLNRKESIEVLSTLLESIDEPFVLCIDAPWGSGKTTFIKIWQQLLINSSFSTLYFNSWENDFSNDALVSFMGEIKAGLSELSIAPKKMEGIQKSFKIAMKVGKNLVKKSIPLVVKIGTCGALDLEKETEKAIADAFEKYSEEQIKEYGLKKNTVIEFKKRLGDFAIQIANKNDVYKPLIIFVDELDRCRPVFAIELLEKIKHLFNVSGIIFVLGIDKTQLSHSIRSIYGLNMDVDGYMKRFIDITFRLPIVDIGNFLVMLFEKFGIVEYLRRTEKSRYEIKDSYLYIHVFEIVKKFQLSLREMEQFLSRLNLVIRTYKTNPWNELELILFLMVIREKDYQLFIRLLHDDFKLDELFGQAYQFPDKGFSWGTFQEKVQAQIMSALKHQNKFKDEIKKIIKQYEQIEKESREKADEGGSKERRILDIWYECNQNGELDFFKILRKIEISERFQV